MCTYRNEQGTWNCEIRVAGVLCICEANRRIEARRGAMAMAKRRARGYA